MVPDTETPTGVIIFA